ncbi:MAG: hypothetical protein ACOCYV_00170 [Planctomycetota bacterium]
MADSLTACLQTLAASLHERHDLPVIVLPALGLAMAIGVALWQLLPPPAAVLPAFAFGLGAGLLIRRRCRQRRRQLVCARFERHFPPTDPGTVAVHRRLAELAAADTDAPVALLARLVAPGPAPETPHADRLPPPTAVRSDHLPLEPESDRFARG